MWEDLQIDRVKEILMRVEYDIRLNIKMWLYADDDDDDVDDDVHNFS
jgi:hypothetical protein